MGKKSFDPHVFGTQVQESAEHLDSALELLEVEEEYSTRDYLRDDLTAARRALNRSEEERKPVEELEQALNSLERAHDRAVKHTMDQNIQDAYGEVRLAYEALHTALEEGVTEEESEVSQEDVDGWRNKLDSLMSDVRSAF